MSDDKVGLGQLRHLYEQMLRGGVGDQTAAAKYLLAPGIECAETLAARLSETERERDQFRQDSERYEAELHQKLTATEAKLAAAEEAGRVLAKELMGKKIGPLAKAIAPLVTEDRIRGLEKQLNEAVGLLRGVVEAWGDAPSIPRFPGFDAIQDAIYPADAFLSRVAPQPTCKVCGEQPSNGVGCHAPQTKDGES